MIILDEKKFAEDCIQNGLIVMKPYFVLSILSRYYYHCCGYKKKKIKELLFAFLQKHYPKYELDGFFWQNAIERLANKAKDNELMIIKGVSITESEMNKIKELSNRCLEKLAFVLLCLAKFQNARNPNNNGWVNLSSKQIFDCARIVCKKDERDIKLGKLRDLGYLEFPKRIDNVNNRVTFIDDDSPEVLFVSDFRELGYEYRKYCGENFIRCAECGVLTKGNEKNTRRYCKDCGVNTNVVNGKKIIYCCDCGEMIFVAAKNNRTKRCKLCQEKYNRMIKREWKKANNE